jgi:Methyltransferase domain
MSPMSMAAAPHCPPEWLDLRESADAAARATAPLAPLGAYLTGERPVIRDLGCGTGAMARWLAGRLPGPQHWIMHDRDPVLLARAAASRPGGADVTVAADRRDVTTLSAAELAGTSLVTASALLDLLTAEEVTALLAACAGRPALLTLSVDGRTELTPADPLDAEIAAAFNDHQRRVAGGRRLLGPDAPAVAAAAFERQGMTVRRYESPWRLGAGRAALIDEWLTGRVEAACEQRPDLAGPAEAYLRRRRAECAAGRLRVVVHHLDLLALPGGGDR